ncbi:MAG: guanylate kinase, partial [Gammaproteobacteria bacterium]|nr:guanylate kinase [Gammaproteobacteria bacterium]
GRATDNEEVIRQRLSEAIDDISHWTEFNHVVINAEIEQAETELLRILSGTAVNTQTRLPEVRNRVRQLLSHV